MDKISKALKKFSGEEKDKIKKLMVLIKNGAFTGLDLKKLKGQNDIFRVRKGKIRILYRVDCSKKIYILAIEKRSDNTYNF
ncbi:MAG: hypothetical protein V1770_02665 [bacterium]